MAHGLEIRTPLVDVAFFRALLPLLAGPHPPGKREMAEAAEPPLPADLLRRPKTGFGIPVQEWSRDLSVAKSPRRDLRAWALRVLDPGEGRPRRIAAAPRRWTEPGALEA